MWIPVCVSVILVPANLLSSISNADKLTKLSLSLKCKIMILPSDLQITYSHVKENLPEGYGEKLYALNAEKSAQILEDSSADIKMNHS
jgi:hypothetical protein